MGHLGFPCLGFPVWGKCLFLLEVDSLVRAKILQISHTSNLSHLVKYLCKRFTFPQICLYKGSLSETLQNLAAWGDRFLPSFLYSLFMILLKLANWERL